MPPAAELIQLLAICGGILALMKVGWAVAAFFVGLAKGLETLTAAVTALTERFDAHASDITDGLSDVRERVAKLEAHHEDMQ
jgi:hypothetical protein